jgi:ribonucleoside-diphosphate reductase beta chain
MAILDPGLDLKLRPMKYPIFYSIYKAALKNTWFVEEIDFTKDIEDIHQKLSISERHMLNRLIAFFATGDNIVQENLVLNLFKHMNAPEVKLYLGRQIYEESLHIDFYLTLLDNYLPDLKEREAAFDAVKNIPSVKKKADFSFKWMNFINELDEIKTDEDRRKVLLNLIAFAACNEGLFFFGAFAYVYYLRSKGLLNGLATGTNWVFRDESLHITNAYELVKVVKQEYPHLFDARMKKDVVDMMKEALECEFTFAQDLLKGGVAGISLPEMRQYLEYIADKRLELLGIEPIYHQKKQPFLFMELQDIQELTNFFERNVSAYQLGITQEEIKFDEKF